jgi:hypothetical protein
MVTRVSPVAPRETNHQDDTTIGTSSEVVQDVVSSDDDHRSQTRGPTTTMRLRQTEKHFESQSVANPLEIFLHANPQEAQRA